jgi:hypothetical protein
VISADHLPGHLRMVALIAALAAACALLPASGASAAVREVGATTLFSAPPCDTAINCQVITRVTAFQLKVGNRNNVSRVPRNGTLMAFTLGLPRVIAKFYASFSDTYGGAPTARIAVLRHAPRKGATKYRYKLVGQGPRVNLKNYLGGTPSFVLAKPLAVRKGDMIALTTDTWMPGFVVRAEDATSTWRASRPSGKCTASGTDMTNLITPRMQGKVGEIRRYSCGFVGARVLYHATVVDTPEKSK